MSAEDADAGLAAEIPDPGKTFAAARKLRTLPVNKGMLLPVGVAALLPMVAAGTTQLPLRDLLKVARGLLL
jgi:hypothetical protein